MIRCSIKKTEYLIYGRVYINLRDKLNTHSFIQRNNSHLFLRRFFSLITPQRTRVTRVKPFTSALAVVGIQT